MTIKQEDDLVNIAMALGYQVIGSTVAELGREFGWLELLDKATGEKFRWNPVVHAGDRYKLIKAAEMMVDFAASGNFANVIVPIPGTDECKMLQFSKVADEQVEAMAILSVAGAWARAKLDMQEHAA